MWFDFRGELVMNVHANFVATVLEHHPIRFTEDVRRLVDLLVAVAID